MNYHYDSYRYETTVQTANGTRWASDEEVFDALTKINLMDRHYPACGLPLISDGRTAYVNNSDSHSLIIGSTGSKKSRLFVMPMLEMIARAGESAIVTDPKGELYDRTSGLFSREGYDVVVMNFRDPSHSNGWNPLYSAYQFHKEGQTDKALDMFSDLSSFLYYEKPGSHMDPFWNQKSKAIFQGLCQMLLEDECISASEISLSTIVTLAYNLSDEVSGSLESVLSVIQKYPEDSLARATLQQAMVGSEKTIVNITTSMLAPLQIFSTNKSLLKMLSTHEIDFRTLGQKKSILYIIMPDEKTTMHPLVGMAIKNCYEILIDTAQHLENKTLPVRVNYILDEFSNIPQIPDMSSMITAARSRNIRFYLIVQSMQQLTGKYGEDAYTLRSNCNDWVFLTSRELELLKELQELCGCDAKTGQPLITVSQLQRLRKESGEALVLCGRLYPYLSHLADIGQYPFADVDPQPLPSLPSDVVEPFSIKKYYVRRQEYLKKNVENLLASMKESGQSHQTMKTENKEPSFYDELDKRYQELYQKMRK